MSFFSNIKQFFATQPRRAISRMGSVIYTGIQTFRDNSAPKNMYLAGEHSTKRNKLRVYVQDSHHDLSPQVRMTLIGKSRYYAENNPFVSKVLDVIDSFVNGANGVSVVPNNGKERVDAIASKAWEEWKNDCDFLGRLKFSSLTSMILRLMLVDGECFVVKRECPGERVQKKVQILETHRCVNPSVVTNKNIIDGIKYDNFGRPISYFLVDGLDSGAQPKEFASEDVIHCYIPTRAGQLRGLPYGTSALTALQDFEMLEEAEMDAAKGNARKLAIVETPEGELVDDNLIAKMARGEDVESEGDPGVFQKPMDEREHRLMEEDFGGHVWFVKSGTKWNQNPGERPSKTMQEFWVYSIEKICIAYNVSKILVFPQSLQGTTARADIAATEATFKMLFSVLEEIALKLYQFGISGFSSRFSSHNNFANAKVVPPKVLTADIVRETNATLSELSAGITTLQDVCGADGRDWRETLRKRAETVAYWRTLCDEYGIEGESLRRLVYNPVNNLATQIETERESSVGNDKDLKKETMKETKP